ncbi:MAG: rhodanese-like protein [Chlorobi bacterium]|jgi:rhodanese-related sulfurtransferase|nr:rhodanese-like protein [Chlorobiota bacterium]
MIKHLTMLAVAAGLFVYAGDLHAQTGKTCEKGKACCMAKDKEKAKLSEMKTVNKDEVVKLIKTNNVTVIDARDAESYAAGHIDGAVNFGTAQLPVDKNAALVFYCGGLKCPMAAKAAKTAIQKGYKNVMVFRGGWAEWSKSQS